MKPLAPFFVAAGLAPAAFADYPALVQDAEPIAYFRFEEEAGAAFAVDSSGNGNDAVDYTELGSGEIGVVGAIGNAIFFNGDGVVVTGLNFDPSQGDFSIEYIFNPIFVPSTGMTVIANRDNAEGEEGGLGRSASIYAANTRYASFLGGDVSDSGSTSPLGIWTHVVLTYENATRRVRTFIDGVEGNSIVLANPVEAATGEWVIGGHKLNNQTWTTGFIDEVAFYDKRLDDLNGDGNASDSVIVSHYEAFRDDAGVLGFETDEVFIEPGDSVELSWTTSPMMEALEIDNGVGDVLSLNTDFGDGRAGGSISVTPTETTTYTITGTSPFETDMLSVEVAVSAAPLIAEGDFTVDRADVIAGEAVQLSWQITDADTAEIDNGVGALTLGDELVSSGMSTVTVNADTTFTLTATNGNGSTAATLMVTTREGDPDLLIAHWQVGEEVGETEGTELISSTGEEFIGTFTGTPTFDTEDPAPVPGGSTASLSFPGSSWVDILGYGGIPGASERTVAFWYKAPLAQPIGVATIISWGPTLGGQRFDIRNVNGSGTVRAEVSGSGSESTTVASDGTWHHVAVVLPEGGTSDGDIQFYIDGTLDMLAVTGSTPLNSGTRLNVRIGSSRTLSARTLVGKLDDIRIYGTALSGVEIAALAGIPVSEMSDFRITDVQRNGDGSVSLEWNGQDGKLYAVDSSTDLGETAWIELVTDLSTNEYTDSIQREGADLLFYRVRELE